MALSGPKNSYDSESPSWIFHECPKLMYWGFTPLFSLTHYQEVASEAEQPTDTLIQDARVAAGGLTHYATMPAFKRDFLNKYFRIKYFPNSFILYLFF